MSEHFIVSLDKCNHLDRSQGLLTFSMDGEIPVEASLKHIPFDGKLSIRLIDELTNWAHVSMNSSKYRNLEFKYENGCYWIITDEHRCFDRGDLFDKIFNGSEFAINSQRNS